MGTGNPDESYHLRTWENTGSAEHNIALNLQLIHFHMIELHQILYIHSNAIFLIGCKGKPRAKISSQFIKDSRLALRDSLLGK